MQTVVIGGGIAGLTAAYELIRAGHRPILIEPASIGGMIASEQSDGFTLECGPNVLVERPAVMSLVRELDLSSSLRYPAVKLYGQYVWFNGRAQKVPAGVLEAIATPLISFGAKLALPLRVVRSGVLEPRAEDESVETFFSRLIGRTASRAMLDPVLKGIYGGNVEELSARSLFSGLWDAGRRGCSVVQYMRERPKGGKPSIFVIEGGIQTLVDTLWRRIEGDLDFVADAACAVTRVGAARYGIMTQSGGLFETDRCIITTAGANLAPLVRSIGPDAAQMIDRMRYASLTVVHLSTPRDQRLIRDAFGMLCPAGMPENFLGVMFNSQIFPGMAPPDKHLLTVILGGAQAGDSAPNEQAIREAVPRLLSEMLDIRDAKILRMTQWRRAIPQLVVGHFRLLEALDALEHNAPGLVFAGVDRGGIGVSDRIRLACEAVKRSAERLASVSDTKQAGRRYEGEELRS